jgi:histidinol-phosphatase
MALKQKHLEKLLDFANRTVRKSEEITLKYFNKKVKFRVKANNSPVTVADTKCEDFILGRIKAKFPEHGVYGEERGIVESGSEFKWIIDPVDGTKNFMRKYPYWGTLLALEYEGEIMLGVISMPVLKEFMHAAKGMGCYLNNKRAKVSKVNKLKDSYLIHGGIDYILAEPYKNNFAELAASCYYSRGFGDCHGHTFIINGQAEIMFDPHVAPYDVAAIKICAEEAGGVFTDLNGNRNIYSGTALTTNGRMHDEVLKIINREFESREVTKSEQ